MPLRAIRLRACPLLPGTCPPTPPGEVMGDPPEPWLPAQPPDHGPGIEPRTPRTREHHVSKPPEGQQAASLSLRKKILFTAILLGLMLALLEGVAIVYLRATQGYDGRHLLQYAFDPYKNILPTPGYRDIRGVTHNSVGFRRRTEVEVRKPEGTLRVFLMGASTAFGTGGLWSHIDPNYPVLDDSETIDAYIEPMLQRAFPDRRVEVINAAIPSIWVHHHLIYLNQAILRYQPDLVLFLDGFNDHFFFGRDHDQFAAYAYGEQSRVIMGPPTLRSLASMNGWWLFRRSALAHALLRNARTVRTLLTPAPEQSPIDVEQALVQLEEIFAANALAMMERTALILQHEGIPALFMLQPLLILDRNRPGMEEMEERLLEFNVQSTLPNFEAFMHRAAPLVSAMSSESLTALGADYLDLTRLYWDGSVPGQVFTDYAHLTPEANRRLAEEVIRRIVPTLTRTLSPPEGAPPALPGAEAPPTAPG